MKIKKLISLIITGTVLMSALTSCTSSSNKTDTTNATTSNSTQVEASKGEAEASTGGTITYALGSKWSTLMPYNSSNFYNWAVADKLFDTLIRVTEDYKIEPRNAKSWEMSEDGKVMTLKLNENALWHDGQKVTAHDWEYTINLMSQPELVEMSTKTYLAPFVGIDDAGNAVAGEKVGCVALDDYTLQLTFKEATYAEAFFLAYGKYYFVLPEHLLSAIKPADMLKDEFWYKPVGSGPCTFVSEITGTELVMNSFKDYYLGAPKFDQLIYKVIAAANMSTAMMAGEIDVAYPGIAPDEAKSLEGMDGIGIQVCEGRQGQMWVAINNGKFDKKVRQALNYAVDKQMIVDNLLLGEATPVETPISNGTPDFNNSITSKRDVEKAKQLLAEAGFDFNQTLSIVIPGGIREKIAVILQQNFAEVGVKVEVKVMDFATLISGIYQGTYDMCIISNFGNAIPAQWLVQLNPHMSTFSKDIDSKCYDMIMEINAEQDEAKRHDLILKFQELFAEEMPYIILYDEKIFSLVSPSVKNVTITTSDAAWTWEKTK